LIPELRFRTPLVSTDFEDSDLIRTFYLVIFIMLATTYMYFQCTSAIRVLFSDETISRSKILSRALVGSITRDERDFKQAAIFKVNRMMGNAYKLHQQDRPIGSTNTHDLALLNYNKISGKTEPAADFYGIWKSFFNKDLSRKEGIWIQSRVWAGMISQLLLTIGVVITFGVIFSSLIDLYESTFFGEQICNASFDVANCTAPGFNGINPGFIACTEVILEGSECNSSPVELGVLEALCEFIPLNPLTNQTVCDSTRVFSFEEIFATVTGENIQQGDCQAQVTVCFTYAFDDNVQRAACVLGINPGVLFLPYRFEGPMCKNISLISDVLDSKPIFFRQAEELFNDLSDTILPDRWMLEFAATVGLIVGVIVGLSIFVHYLPSTVYTILKFRCGVLGSLRDPGFKKYRSKLGEVVNILGLIIWGTGASILLAVVVVAGGSFLIVWEVTRKFLLDIIAILIGFISTIALRSILVAIVGKTNYTAFYRKRPWVGNVSGVALECWHLALTVYYIFVRVVLLLFSALLYAARVDKPFMADDVGTFGSVDLDKYPTIYRKGLLSAEAHRHPYIERLGFLYLLKIKHGSNFATTSGSVWRLLFVFSLMPWLRKYRIANDDDLPEGLLLQKLAIKSDTKYEQIILQQQQEIRMLREENRELGEGDDSKNNNKADELDDEGSQHSKNVAVIIGEDDE